MKLRESGEMYLETILILTNKGGSVRSVDVGEYMGFTKPSVSRAVGLLRRNGYINVCEDGNLVLTDKGMEIASKIYDRHTTLTDCLVRIGVSRKTASEDACKIEHVISDETFETIKKHIQSAKNN